MADMKTLSINGGNPFTIHDTGAVRKTGDTMTGDLDMSGHRVLNLSEPVTDSDPVTRKYADDNYAHAGYGLGADCANLNSVFDIKANGWYTTAGDTPDDTPLLCHAIVMNGGDDITVTAWTFDGALSYKLTKNKGTWGSWETMLDAISVMGVPNGDFDEIKTSGIYWMQLASCTNGPITTGYGQLIVSNVGTTCLQRFYKYGDGKIYMRYYINNVWETWKRVDAGANEEVLNALLGASE